jgi:myo-inositol catabolism protein IolC
LKGGFVLGYEKDLLILPFDHRGSLLKKLYGVEGRKPSKEESENYSFLKSMVYEGFKKSLGLGVPKEKTAVLVDAEFGSDILADAKKNGILTAMPLEKSGQNEFDFEHENFESLVKEMDSDFVKVLVRYNPEGDSVLNERQLVRLKRVSDYCKSIGKHFLFELLVPATEKQKESNPADYDVLVRPKLMVSAIKEIQDFGVEPDVWKLEGVSRVEDSKALVEQCHVNGRTAGIITLGRGEDMNKVREWLRTGAKVKGIIGFAVGRTVFWEPMKALHEKKISFEEASAQVADNYKALVDLWESERV